MLTVSRFTRNDFLGISLSAACILASPTGYANIIDTTYGVGAGSFEPGTFVNNGVSGYTYMSLPPGATTITGWTVGGPGDGVDWLLSPSFRVDTGVHAVDLRLGTASSIATTIPTVVGSIYRLSFGAASVVNGNNTGIVSAGSLLNEPFTAPFSAAFSSQTFQPLSFLFTALGPTTTIQFTATGSSAPGYYGPAIDTVNVDLAVPLPLPSSILLFGTGLVGMFGRGLMRNKPAA